MVRFGADVPGVLVVIEAIRHYGLLADGNGAENIAHARELLAVPTHPNEPETPEAAADQPRVLPRPCPCCGGRMIVIETFSRGCQPKHQPTPPPAAILPSAWMVLSSRRPKTCTAGDIARPDTGPADCGD